MSQDRQDVLTYDDREGSVMFPGELLADVTKKADGHVCGCRVYRGTHEATGTLFVCINYGAEPLGQHMVLQRFASRELMIEFLCGVKDEVPPEETGSQLGFAVMREVLAKLGGSN